jgi:hypothetical protein
MANGPTVVNTGGGGAGGWLVAIVLLLIVVGVFFFFGGFGLIHDKGGADVNVKIDTPSVPAAPTNGGG